MFGFALRQTRQVFTSLVAVPLVIGYVHPRFLVDAQSFRNAVDVVEVADHLSRDSDLIIRKTVLTQRHNVAITHVAWCQSKLDGVVAKGTIILRQFCLSVIECQLTRELFITRLPTEVFGMGERSVITVVRVTHYSCQHFPPRR